jgi:hypothetical protein
LFLPLSCRRLLVFPKGNKQSEPQAQEYLAIYLDAPEAAWTPQHMNPKALFKLTVHCHSDPAGSMVKGMCDLARAWGGYSSFCRWLLQSSSLFAMKLCFNDQLLCMLPL